MKRHRWLLLVGVLVSLIAATGVVAQQPKVGYVYPPVVQAGSTSEVQLGGYDFTSDMQFFLHDDRVKLIPLTAPGKFFVPEPPYWFGEKGFSTAFPIPREITVRIEVPSDMPPGLVRWQVANANGASPTGVFYVSGSEEMMESRVRDDQVQDLPSLPLAISGRLRKISEVDRYRITAEKNGPISLDLMARRLGSNFSAVVEVRDSAGALVKDEADTEGLDTQLTFAAKAGEAYMISIFDADFRGNRAYVYRLALTPAARVVATIPAVARQGETRDFEVFIDVGRDEIVSERRSIAASEFILAGRVSEIPQFTESDLKERLDVPGAVTGTIKGDSTEDRFTFAAMKGESWRVQLASRAIGSRLDVSLSIKDATGKVVKTNDDLPGTPDAGLDFTSPADGEYTCVVTDMSGRAGSAAAVYHLSIDRLQPGFVLTTAQQILVPVGGTGQLALKVLRPAGFKGEIAIRIEGLPEGVTVAEGLKIPEGKNDLKIAIQAAKDAATVGAMLRVVGTAAIGEQTIEHVATAPLAGNLCPLSPEDNQTTSILLATTMKPPVTIALVDKNRQRAVHLGTTYPAPFLIKRDEGFVGEVVLQMAASQSRHRQGIHGPIMTVATDQTKALYPCFMPEWLATDRTTRMSVVGVVKVPDAKGNVRSLVATADARVTMILEGALLKVAHTATDVTMRPGEALDVPVEVSRSSKLRDEVVVSLQVPARLQGKITAEPIMLASNEHRAVLRISTLEGSDVSGDWSLVVKASAMQEGQWPVISQTTLPVRFISSDAATAAAE